MLYDELQTDAVVDGEAALEFMKEATKLATATELEGIAARLAVKSAGFRARLAPDRIGQLDADGFTEVVSRIFSIRRKADRLIKSNGLDRLRSELATLLYGEGPVSARLDRFTSQITGLESAMILALATESLHFTDPDRYWLWTHWIWNPQTKTGALRLVTHDAADLETAGTGATYDRVGRAMVALDRHGHLAGYARAAAGLFGTDVFLACVYAVYMATMFRLKLSQEFNRIVPELPELVERVLGVRSTRGTDG